MGARTQGCTSMCTRWADRGASSLQPGKPSANGWLDISCHLFVHMVFAPCSGVTYLGFEVFDGGSYPRLHFLVHSSLPYIHTYLPYLLEAFFRDLGPFKNGTGMYCSVLFCTVLVLEWSWNGPGMILEWSWNGTVLVLERSGNAPGMVLELSWNGPEMCCSVLFCIVLVLEWSRNCPGLVLFWSCSVGETP